MDKLLVYYINKGISAAKNSDFDMALEYFEKAIKKDKYNYIGYFNKGRCLYEAKKNDESLQFFKKAMVLNPKCFDSYIYTAAIMFESSDYNEALDIINKLLTYNPNIPEAYSIKGMILTELCEYEKALEFFDKAIEQNDNYEYHFKKGLCLIKDNKKEKALDEFNKVLVMNPNFAQAYINKAAILFERKQYNDVLKNIDISISINSDIPEAYFNKAMALAKLFNYEESILSFNKAISLYPKYINALYNKGLCFGYMGRNDEALECFNKVLEIDDKHSDAHYNKGIALLNKKEYQNAIEEFELAGQLDDSKKDEIKLNINNSLQFELRDKYYNYEKLIINENSIIEPDSSISVPEGYRHTIKQGNVCFTFYRLNIAVYCRAYYDDSGIFDELQEIISIMKTNTLNEYNQLVSFICTTDIIGKLKSRWANFIESINENILNKESIKHSNLASYQYKYEIGEVLEVMAIVRKLITNNVLDLNLQVYRDREGKIKKGVLVDYICNGFNNYPILKSEFEKAYVPKLRNFIGHNNYKIVDNNIIDLDNSNFSMSSQEFYESSVSLINLQNTILWFFQMMTIESYVPSILDSGIIELMLFVNKDNCILDVIAFQLWCFYDYDNNFEWVSNINICKSENKFKIYFSKETTFDEIIFETLTLKQYDYLFEQKIAKANIKLFSIAPLINVDNKDLELINIKGEVFQILGEYYEKEVPINYFIDDLMH
jgi:tetratricopeptide (TPR) repeat protein